MLDKTLSGLGAVALLPSCPEAAPVVVVRAGLQQCTPGNCKHSAAAPGPWEPHTAPECAVLHSRCRRGLKMQHMTPFTAGL